MFAEEILDTNSQVLRKTTENLNEGNRQYGRYSNLVPHE
jgi:hypothetical protein